jgi:hypothetical protein
VALIAQFIIFAAIDPSKLLDGNHVTQCLMFLPCLTFGLMIDIQIIVSTYGYKPVSFRDLPYRHARKFMLALGYASLIISLIAYVFCLLVFGGLNKDHVLRQAVFVIFIVKGLTWSPFFGMEFYDTLFEHIYHDV